MAKRKFFEEDLEESKGENFQLSEEDFKAQNAFEKAAQYNQANFKNLFVLQPQTNIKTTPIKNPFNKTTPGKNG
jgi:hypothetical protein